MKALTIRFPKSLHERIRALAKAEGVSLNQFVLLATAEKAAALDTRQQMEILQSRTERAEIEASRRNTTPANLLRELLDKGPKLDPTPEDQVPES